MIVEHIRNGQRVPLGGKVAQGGRRDLGHLHHAVANLLQHSALGAERTIGHDFDVDFTARLLAHSVGEGRQLDVHRMILCQVVSQLHVGCSHRGDGHSQQQDSRKQYAQGLFHVEVPPFFVACRFLSVRRLTGLLRQVPLLNGWQPLHASLAFTASSASSPWRTPADQRGSSRAG